MAVAAVPLNHLRPPNLLAKTIINSTPDTYSGSDVVNIEKVDSTRSVLLPSRIPAITPIIKADGTITINTPSISLPVNANFSFIIPPIFSLNTREKPQSPCRMPQNFGVSSGATLRSTHRPVNFPSSSVRVQPGATPSHSP